MEHIDTPASHFETTRYGSLRGKWRVVDLLPPETLAKLKRFRDRLADVELKRQLAAKRVEREVRKVA